MPLEIVHYPHPVLKTKSRPITEISFGLQDVVREMFELMYEAHGIGLAANQVGIPYRFFVLNLTADPEETEEELVFLNPEISGRRGSDEGEEGCLSLPEIYGEVRRAEEITVDAFDLDGQPFRLQVTDLAARAIQHETDHLDGIMFFERMTESARRELEPRIRDFVSRFQKNQETGKYPSTPEIEKALQDQPAP